MVEKQRNQLASLVEDDNIARRHRFGGHVDPLGALDESSMRWLSFGVILAFSAVMLGVALFGPA